MNFDRKYDDSDGKAAEEKKFAELPRIFDENGERIAADSQAGAYSQNNVGKQYPSGAFPALDVAYSDYNIRGTANFVPNKNFSANFPTNSYNEQPNRQMSQNVQPSDYDNSGQSRDENPANSVYDAAESERGMVNRPYSGGRADSGSRRQNSSNNKADYAYLQSGRNATEIPAQQNIPVQEDYEGYSSDETLQAASYANEEFQTNLSGEIGVQPACFDPSDYDYNYDANNYAAENPQPQPIYNQPEEQSPINSHEGEAYTEMAYEPDYPVGQEMGYDYYPDENNYAYQDEEQQLAARVATSQIGSYNFQTQSYETTNFVNTAQPHDNYASLEEVLPQALPYQGEVVPDNQNAAHYFPQEEEALAADLSHLSADMQQMDDEINAFLPANVGPQTMPFDLPMEDGRDSWSAGANGFAKEQDFYEENEDFYPNGSPELSGRRQSNLVSRENNFAGKQSYDDPDFYDWAAVPAEVGVPQRYENIEPQLRKSKKGLYFVAGVVMLLLIGGGFYLYSGRSGFNFDHKTGPVIIHKDETAYKVKSKDTVQENSASQEESVTEGVSNSSNADSGQKTLIDKTEAPVEIQKMDERLPFSGQHSQFDQSSVDSLVKTAVAHATPVHIVPSVKVNAERKILYSSVRSEQLLVPGGRVANNGIKTMAVMPAVTPMSADAYSAGVR